MTTIVYRDGKIAADTACSNTYSVTPGAVHKIAGHHGCLAAAAGYATFTGGFLRWFTSGEPEGKMPEPVDDNEGHDVGIIIRPDFSKWIYEKGGRYMLSGDYYACGSGREHAQGALYMGATAYLAVEAACRHDLRTAPPIDILELGENSPWTH